MAYIRKRRGNWQVQIRRQNCPPICRSFISRKDTEAWGRNMEVQADRRGHQNELLVLSAIPPTSET